MKLAIGCDEAAYRLKTIIMEHLEEKHPEIEVADFGAAQGDTVLYPDVAYTVADAVASGEFQRGEQAGRGCFRARPDGENRLHASQTRGHDRRRRGRHAVP